MNHDPDDLQTLNELIEFDHVRRIKYGVAKANFGVYMSCDGCGRAYLDGKYTPMVHTEWRDHCFVCRQPNARFAFVSQYHGQQHSWDDDSVWGRMPFEKEFQVLSEVVRFLLSEDQGVYKQTRPLASTRDMVKSLRDHGFTISLREPANYDHPPSMETRYDSAFLWKVRIPGEAKSWNMFRFTEYVSCWTEVVNLISQCDSCEASASSFSLGSLEEEDLKQLKTECYRIKLSNREEGEGAFKLLSFIRSATRLSA